MTEDLTQISRGALTVSVQLTAEVAHNPTQSLRSENCMVAFHVHNHHVGLRAQDFKARKRVAN